MATNTRGALKQELTRYLRTGRAVRHPSRKVGQRKNRIPEMINISQRPELLSALHSLDRIVDKAFGARRILETEADRQRILFQRYSEMIDSERLPVR